LKSKESKRDKSKREMFRGEFRRRDLRDIILSSGGSGVTVGHIVTQLSERLKKAITRQQVHNYLKEPWAKNLVYKEGNRYFMKHVVFYDDWSMLSEYISGLQYFPNFRDLLQNRNFQSKFQENSLENMLYQCSNRIGALVSYIIIEALRPTETVKLKHARKKMAIKFVRDALSPEYLFQTFLATLPYDFRDKYRIGTLEVVTDEDGMMVTDQHGRIKKSATKNSNITPEINELYISENQNPLQELIDAYNRVYPRFHDLLDVGYREYVNRNHQRNMCDHVWEQIIIHKIGVGYKCHNCFRKISEEEFKRVFLN
jgi:hypothetical protein